MQLIKYNSNFFELLSSKITSLTIENDRQGTSEIKIGNLFIIPVSQGILLKTYTYGENIYSTDEQVIIEYIDTLSSQFLNQLDTYKNTLDEIKDFITINQQNIIKRHVL